VCSSPGGSSFGWELVGSGSTPSGGAVGGASSVASGQILYGTGAGVAGSDTNFRYFVGTGNMVVGATTESGVGGRLQVAGNMTIDHRAGSANATIVLVGRNAGAAATAGILANQLGGLVYNAASGANLGHDFQLNNVSQARLTTTGNLLLGTTTDDGTNRLQVAGSIFATGNVIGGNLFDVRSSSGESSDLRLTQVGIAEYRIRNVAASGTLAFINSAGTNVGEVTQGGVWQFFNQTPTTGATQLIVRAGAGQGSTNLQTWQNSGGSTVAFMSPTGEAGSLTWRDTAGGVYVRNADQLMRASFTFVWNSGTTYNGGSNDTGLSRNAAGVIEVNNGTAGTFRDLYLRGVRPVGSTVANLPAAAGNTGMLATVTDANATTIGTTVAGGGANTVLVWSNGTNWRIYAN